MGTTKPKLLIVDDNPVCREQAVAIAEKMCDCVSVESGEEAVQSFTDCFKDEECKYAAILLDFEMPKMNGIDVITEIRKAEAKRKIPKTEQVKIIMTTSNNDRQVVNACKAVGCNHYILKPVTNETLQSKLRQFNILQE